MGLGRAAFTSASKWSSPAQVWAGGAAIGNDLTQAASALKPEIEVMLNALRADSRCRCAALSGSGATVFALVEGHGAAESLAHDLTLAHPSWWVRATDLAG